MATEWGDILVTCLPKGANAADPGMWRLISLISCFSKWFTSCLTILASNRSTGYKANMMGFIAGHQTMKISETLRIMLQKSHEWKWPIIIAKLDLSKAFDCINHKALDKALKAHGIPATLRAALARELTGNTMQFLLQGTMSDKVHLRRGGKQGDPSTPFLWNQLLDLALGPLAKDWECRVFGFTCSDTQAPISNMIWADDCFFIARSEADMKVMIKEATDAIHEVGLRWKASSLQILANINADMHEDSLLITSSDNTPYTFQIVDNLICLGVLLDATGSASPSLEHRYALRNLETLPCSWNATHQEVSYVACLVEFAGFTKQFSGLSLGVWEGGRLLEKLLLRSNPSSSHY